MMTIPTLSNRPLLGRAAPLLVALAGAVLLAACSADSGPTAVGGECTAHAGCGSGVCGAGVCLAAGGDADGDGLDNLAEAVLGSDPTRADTDGDGAPDGDEVGTGATPIDTDGDGRPDALESSVTDSDQDCLPDQLDPQDGQVDLDLSPLLPTVCAREGVCATATGLLTVICGGDGEAACDYGAVPDHQAVETTCDHLDNDCDGETDEASPNDGDCDGVIAADDCDDADASSGARAADGDCDGVIAADDCDDADASSGARAADGDCDGVLSVDDCDDADPGSSSRAEDGDCDGVLTADDCDDADLSLGARVADGDCDGALTADDCDDADGSLGAWAADGDCDGVLTADDCDDADPSSTSRAEDGDCDGALTADDCDDADPSSAARGEDTDCDGVPNLYRIVDSSLTWPEARDDAIALTGDAASSHLVTINSPREAAWVQAMALYGHGDLWLGAALGDDGAFAWVTGEPFTTTNWAGGEPSGGDETYVAMWGGGVGTQPVGRWNDVRPTSAGPRARCWTTLASRAARMCRM